MTLRADRAAAFAALHRKGDPLVLFNIWDAGSAKAVAKAGAKAIATGSWSVAAANGFDDGESLPLEFVLANTRRIVAAVDLPVSIDLESGYGSTPAAVADTVAQAILAGAIGFNLEDQIIGGDGMYAITDQSARIQAARQAATRLALPVFINARTDLFLMADSSRHDAALAAAALERAHAYAQAGASGFFVPGLIDEALIKQICDASPLPVNFMMRTGAPPSKRLAELGVARISHGPGPYRQIAKALEDAARAAIA